MTRSSNTSNMLGLRPHRGDASTSVSEQDPTSALSMYGNRRKPLTPLGKPSCPSCTRWASTPVNPRSLRYTTLFQAHSHLNRLERREVSKHDTSLFRFYPDLAGSPCPGRSVTGSSAMLLSKLHGCDYKCSDEMGRIFLLFGAASFLKREQTARIIVPISPISPEHLHPYDGKV